jgi:hypothetical protein
MVYPDESVPPHTRIARALGGFILKWPPANGLLAAGLLPSRLQKAIFADIAAATQRFGLRGMPTLFQC